MFQPTHGRSVAFCFLHAAPCDVALVFRTGSVMISSLVHPLDFRYVLWSLFACDRHTGGRTPGGPVRLFDLWVMFIEGSCLLRFFFKVCSFIQLVYARRANSFMSPDAPCA